MLPVCSWLYNGFHKSIAERLRFGFGGVLARSRFRRMVLMTLAGLELIARSCLANYLAYFFLHLTGVFGFGLMHYADGVMGRGVL